MTQKPKVASPIINFAPNLEVTGQIDPILNKNRELIFIVFSKSSCRLLKNKKF